MDYEFKEDIFMKNNIEPKFKETEIGLIPEDWNLKPIKSFCKKITSGGTPSRKLEEYWVDGNIFWLKTKELSDSNLYRTEEKITLEGLANSSTKLFPVDTVIMAMYGATVGKLGILKKEMTTNQACCALIADEKVSNHLFIFYALLNYRDRLINLACGAAQQNLNQDIIKNLKIPFPQKEEQEKIINILSSLDSKIELNQRMNQTLEEIGRAIFKHWFVDFEFPDEQGRPYKFLGGEMVDSELGEIPKGWEVKSLGSICKIIMGQSPKSEFYNEEKEGLPFHQGVTDFNERFPTHRTYCTVEKKIAENKDILLSVRAPVGRINVANTKIVIGRGLCAIKHKKCLQSFLFYLLKHIFSEEDSIGSGTVFNAVNKKEVNDLKVLAPNGTLDKEFNELIKPLDEKIEFLNAESNDLSQIRDSLLPKLMSGKIRVKKEEGDVIDARRSSSASENS